MSDAAGKGGGGGGKGSGGRGKGSSSASSKSSSASASRASKTPQRAKNKSRSTNPSPASAPRVDWTPQSAGNVSRSTNTSSASAPRASNTPQRAKNKSRLTSSSSASASRGSRNSRNTGNASRSTHKQKENKPLTNCPCPTKPANPRVKCVPFRPISRPRLIPERVSAPPTLPQTAVSPLHSQLSTDNDEMCIMDLPHPVTSSGTRSDLVHPATATRASTSDPILANIKGPLTIRTRRRMGRQPQSGDIFVEETIDILGANDPSATVEQVKGRPIQQGARDFKVNNENGKNSPSVGGGAVIAAGIAQLQFAVQLPSQGPLDFTWDQQFTTTQDAQPILVDFTQRPLEVQSINAINKNDLTGPVNIALHLNSTRGEETPIMTTTQTTAQPQAAPPSNCNVPSSANTLIRNAIEIRFGESKALPTTELRKKVPSLAKNLGHPQIRERVFFGDGVIRLDRDMLIRPEDGVGEMKEDVRTYDFVPATLPAMGERRFSMAPYSELSGFPSLLNIHGERARTRSPIVNARVSTGSTRSSSTSSLATAIPYRADGPMNRTSICPTASSPSVQTARSRESSLSATSGRSSRSKLQIAPSNQKKVSARTGVSMNRLERAQSTPPPFVSRQQPAKTSTEVSSLESSALVTAQRPSSGMSSSASIATDPTQASMIASFKTPPRGQWSTPMLDRYAPATHSTPRTRNSLSTPSSTGTARSIGRSTPQSRKQSQATPTRSQTVATPRCYSPYTINQRQASGHRSHRGVTQSAGNRSDHGHKSRSGKSSKTSRSSRHPTAFNIVNGERMFKRGNTPAKPATDGSTTHSISANRMARKARSCRKLFSPDSNTKSRDLNATSSNATTNYNGISASALSTTGMEATTMIEEPVNRLAKPCYRREPHRQCRGCGKPLTQKKKSTASAAQNPSIQMLETDSNASNGGGVRFKVKMRFDFSELLKQEKMPSFEPSTSASSRSNQIGASAVVCLPPGVIPEKATIIGIAPNNDPSK
ncbi:unnamed protein product, partial [Mesorhabditis belari]|uniref:Uncharacterized protein n=1 Tax=Mesorhabditis belari TaxID=2138241 RepID=A0AAF3F357_9BILA